MERDPTPYAHEVRIVDLGHGHIEATALPKYAWRELDLPDRVRSDWEACASGQMHSGGEWVPFVPSASQLAFEAASNRKRATRRARTAVRRHCKLRGVTTLLTLTYRENMQDRDRMARDLDVFIKRVRRVVRGFEYVCVFERQKRGAWHAHLAVRRVLSHYVHRKTLVKSYDLLRSMWRGVVGVDNGNIDVSRNKRCARSPAHLASYLSKYIGKSIGEGERHENSYSASEGKLPGASVIRVDSPHLIDGMAAAVDALSGLWNHADRSLSTYQIDHGRGLYFVVAPRPR